MNEVHFSIRPIASILLAFLMSTCFALTLSSTEKTYSPKSDDEIEVLSVVLQSEVEANKWTKRDLICFSVEQMAPSSKLVKILRQQNLNVCSSAERPKKFNCGFDVSMQFVNLDNSLISGVHAEVQDLREINSGDAHIAARLRNGDYSVRKIDGKWAISGYVFSK